MANPQQSVYAFSPKSVKLLVFLDPSTGTLTDLLALALPASLITLIKSIRSGDVPIIDLQAKVQFIITNAKNAALIGQVHTCNYLPGGPVASVYQAQATCNDFPSNWVDIIDLTVRTSTTLPIPKSGTLSAGLAIDDFKFSQSSWKW